MIAGVAKVVLAVTDQDEAGDERWLEVRTPDHATVLVLSRRNDEHPVVDDERPPSSDVFFCCDDLHATYTQLLDRGVVFAQPPVELPFGWWSMFNDPDGNRYALVPRERC